MFKKLINSRKHELLRRRHRKQIYFVVRARGGVVEKGIDFSPHYLNHEEYIK